MNDTPLRLLIVEDNRPLAENLFEYFGHDRRYVLDFAPDGLTALHLVATQSYDVIVLDVMLPGVSGFDICRRLREDLGCQTPVIFMTAKDQLPDKEAGFGAGADDYLVKPFNLKELKLRVDALGRRRLPSRTGVVHMPGIGFDPGRLVVSVAGHPDLALSGIGARLFEMLIRAYPDFVSYDRIVDTVWGEREVDRHTVRTHVYALRKALQDHTGQTLIKTLHGRGYRLLSPEEVQA
ncbi:response regulator transcription factor [Pusillimonas minor]|uniref:Response regulator transcription factor n=1 Tax=Pusillimonas minor TaxID=2697024 RepID=A0A842HKY9_9BURK|nr:response regulator transcription factor [Pusillimonas minor]MBC2768947.1 response regulator transcription factor [Pusillimonas minor]